MRGMVWCRESNSWKSLHVIDSSHTTPPLSLPSLSSSSLLILIISQHGMTWYDIIVNMKVNMKMKGFSIHRLHPNPNLHLFSGISNITSVFNGPSVVLIHIQLASTVPANCATSLALPCLALAWLG